MIKPQFGFTAYMLFFLFILSISSCVSTEKATYFNQLKESEFPEKDFEQVIQKNDLLGIQVSSINPEAAIIFNTPVGTTNAGGANTTAPSSGYLVGADGTIKFPVLGTMQAAGMTLRQLNDNIANLLIQRKLLIDPIVSVRLLNFRVTVLGEVARPAVVPVASEKISLLEAIGMAGDLTIFAKRDNVLLIRVEEGKRLTRRINLNDTNLFTSPYYYLKTNDVIYVEPNKAKIATSSRSSQIAPLIISSLSLVGIALNILINSR